MLATFLGGWEVVMIPTLVLILLLAKKLPDILRCMGNGISEFRKALDHRAQDAGRSVGGIFGKPAAEALMPDNQTAELYNPAVFRRDGKRRPVRNLFRGLWHNLLRLLRVRK